MIRTSNVNRTKYCAIQIPWFLKLLKTVLKKIKHIYIYTVYIYFFLSKPKTNFSLSVCAGLLYLFLCILPVGPLLSPLKEILFGGDCK